MQVLTKKEYDEEVAKLFMFAVMLGYSIQQAVEYVDNNRRDHFNRHKMIVPLDLLWE